MRVLADNNCSLDNCYFGRFVDKYYFVDKYHFVEQVGNNYFRFDIHFAVSKYYFDRVVDKKKYYFVNKRYFVANIYYVVRGRKAQYFANKYYFDVLVDMHEYDFVNFLGESGWVARVV